MRCFRKTGLSATVARRRGRIRDAGEESYLSISAVSFDADMTLWDFRRVMRHSLKHALPELQRCVRTPFTLDLTVDNMIAIRNQFSDEVEGEIWSLEEIRRRAFERTLEHVGHPDRDLAAHLNTMYLKHRFEDIELYSDVIPTFDVLVPHFRLGLLSNGTLIRSAAVLKNGLRKCAQLAPCQLSIFLITWRPSAASRWWHSAQLFASRIASNASAKSAVATPSRCNCRNQVIRRRLRFKSSGTHIELFAGRVTLS